MGREDQYGRPLPPRLDPRAGRAPHDREPHDREPHERTPHERGRRRRTARGVVVTRAVAAVVSAALLAVSGWGWYLSQVADASVNRTDAIPTSGNDGIGTDVNLLLVGQDGRGDLTPEQLAELNAGANDSGGLNTDTMILVHIPADGSHASFVSFPRDSYVDIPGHGKDKLNAAYAYGYTSAGSGASAAEKEAAGAQLLVQTISKLSGLQIDHYAEVDLLGFFNLSTVVGGVEVNLCAPVDDSAFSGAVFPAGKQTISGADALKFVRQRHGLPRGDLDRIVRQQVFIAGVLRKVLSEDVLLDLGKQRQLVKAAAGSLTVDRSLDLLDLAKQMQSVTAGSIQFQTVPVADANARDDQGRSVVQLADADTLHAFFAQLSAEPDTAQGGGQAAPETVAPGEVKVAVYNGSGRAGLAGQAATALTTAGFVVTSTGNADSSDYATTEIRYAAGDEALAATLAASIPGAALKQVDDATAGTVQLVIGKDFNGVGQAVTAPAAPASSSADTPRTAADTSCIN
jgi:LCP family protein required for cell wall assembly